MLKLVYADDSFHLEYMTQSVENWAKDRAILALRTIQDFYLEPSSASFLILKDLPFITELYQIQRDCLGLLNINPCDAEYCEVSLKGHWISHDEGYCCGTFVCALGDRLELFLEKIWQASQNSILVTEE